jgi:hypothetical protein
VVEPSRLRLRETLVFMLLTSLFVGAVVFVWTSPDSSVTAAGRAVGRAFGVSATKPVVRASTVASATPAKVATSTPHVPPTVRELVVHTVVVKEQPVAAPVHPATKAAAPKRAPVVRPLVIPAKQALVSPSFRYDGVSTPQAPYDWKDLEIFESAATKDPNLLSWYVGWDQPYDPTIVAATWARGMLPMITWEPRPTQTPTGPGTDPGVNAQYTLESIIDGSHDAFIEAWAKAAAAQHYPLVLRFAHEMNGNWFPWSEQTNGNSAGQYVAAWRHVHDIFTAEGATNVIWLWSPNIDTWCGTCTNTHSTPMAELYPGAAYVDWVGLTGYYRKVITNPDGSIKPATYDNTFGSSISELEAAAPGKKVLLSEVGATEVGGQKEAWMQSVFAGVEADPNLLGLVWFDHSYDGNDWRIESSPAASAAWAAGVTDADADFGSVFDVTASAASPQAVRSGVLAPAAIAGEEVGRRAARRRAT